MKNKNEFTSHSATWNLTDRVAQFQAGLLSGQVSLSDSVEGFHQMKYQERVIEGAFLGLGVGGRSLSEKGSLGEAFVRGEDLVVCYPESSDQTFSLQVYRKAQVFENGIVQIDAMLSIETRLLESFPEIQIQSELRCEGAVELSEQGTAGELSVVGQHKGKGALVFRMANRDWSYAEFAPSEDAGRWRFDFQGEKNSMVERRLGGTFLEKGVIRRLRLRGVFLPRENDLQLASECLAAFRSEAPPLTV